VLDSLDRFRGCLLGLAAGDAFGAQLERVGDPFHAPVTLEPPFRYSDDTQLAMYVARGLLEAFELGRGEELVGEWVGKVLIEWHEDPTTTARNPDASTLAAISRMIGGRGWKDCGDPLARPSVVAVRAAAVGLAYAPDEVDGPVRASTWVTHHNGHALEAATFVAWLVSRLVRGAELTPALVEEGRERVAYLGLDGSLADSLADALALHASLRDRPRQWLPEEEIAPGDGGWHAESAVGLAVLCALLAQGDTPEGFEEAIEQAARIRGDSDAVAALTGLILGAAHGVGVVPNHFLEPMESLEVLSGLAEALHEEAGGLPRSDAAAARAPRARERKRLWASSPDAPATDRDWEMADEIDRAQIQAHTLLESQAAPPAKGVATKWIEEGVEVDRKALLDSWKRA
jgi:ADP-ribosylglycohydrolase